MKILVAKADIPRDTGTPKILKDMILGAYDNPDVDITFMDTEGYISVKNYLGANSGIKGGELSLNGLNSTYIKIVDTTEDKPTDFKSGKYLWQNDAFVLNPGWTE